MNEKWGSIILILSTLSASIRERDDIALMPDACFEVVLASMVPRTATIPQQSRGQDQHIGKSSALNSKDVSVSAFPPPIYKSLGFKIKTNSHQRHACIQNYRKIHSSHPSPLLPSPPLTCPSQPYRTFSLMPPQFSSSARFSVHDQSYPLPSS